MNSWATPDGIKRDRDRMRRSLDVIINNPAWFARAMAWRMGQMFKYSAGAPLIRESGDEGITDFLPGSRRSTTGGKSERGQGYRPDRSRDSYGTTIMALGAAFEWARPAARGLQRGIKESLLLFVILGAVAIFLLSPRRALVIGLVPAYYILFQSIMHYEFRYILPMHYFVFVSAGVTWVLLFSFAYRTAKRLIPGRKESASEVGI